MKRISYLFFLSIVITILFGSCNDTQTYAELLKSEKALIADYITRNNINVLSEFPKDSIFAKNEFVLTQSGLYFQLVKRGVSPDSLNLELSNKVIPRYIQYTLSASPDSISNWSTIDFPYPSTFIYGNSSEGCVAFQEAAGYMKRNEAEAQIIVPSKIGFNENMLTVTPLRYYMKIKIQK
ncbi:MAG: DUF4827 family protein [Paludibacter sp.]